MARWHNEAHEVARTADDLRAADDQGRAIVFRGGTIVTMDETVPDQLVGDVTIRGGVIERVEPHGEGSTPSPEALVVEASGKIVLPGMHDTHRHCWQTQLRRMFADVDLGHYVDVAHGRLGPRYRPEDIHVATLLAGLGALDAGVTSLLDFAHNARSAEHSDASIEGHQGAGVKAVVAFGPPLSGEWERQWPGDLSRLAGRTDGTVHTVSMGVFGTSELGGDGIALTPDNVRFARELGIPVAVDATFGPSASQNIERLGELGMLGPDITLIHATALTAKAWDHIADAGTRVSLTTTSDAEIGIFGAIPPIQIALDRRVRAGLSVDVECSLSSDLFTQMRATYTIQRMLAFHQSESSADGPEPMSPRRVLEMATVDGAAVNHLQATSGTLSPGKAADLIVIAADDIATMPMNNAPSSVVLGSDTRSVRHVFVDGRVRKWDGSIVGVDVGRLHDQVKASRDRLLRDSGYSPDPMR